RGHLKGARRAGQRKTGIRTTQKNLPDSTHGRKLRAIVSMAAFAHLHRDLPSPARDFEEDRDVKRRIRLRGITGEVEGKIWESDTILRAGRLSTLEVVIDDSSVSRRHAELRFTNGGWRVRDLGSTNGTFLNGNRLGPGE